jgi:glycosyltransferase 2 family protein
MKNKIESLIKSKNLYYASFLVIIIYIAFLLYADFQNILLAIKKFNLNYLPLIFLLIILAQTMMFLRWNYLLKRLNINLPFKINLKIYFSSWATFFAPAKSGELVKCFLLKKMYQVPYRTSAPIIFIEQLTDLIAILLFSLLGVSLFNILPLTQVLTLFLFAIVAIIILLALLSFRNFVLKLINFFKKFSFLSKRMEDFEQLYLTANSLIKPRVLFTALFFGIGFWFSLGLILYFSLLAFKINLSLLIPLAIFCLATLIGVLSFIPSGIGTMEASTFIFLITQGVPKSVAVIITILLRVFTLWISVIIGILALFSLLKEKSFHDPQTPENLEPKIEEYPQLEEDPKIEEEIHESSLKPET